ncbi:CCA tRNA nucleotidyltransferase [Methylobacterium planeticum]|uniref:CCA tRNA nucleotidyltransferase n=1 Tax=Methylobacterium planeticum TaxID=2615211 RepID=A0A6N6MWF0_9HYPH|nr:CCA tRNA nucleotidyltransferase [Methylobacterium planeticum]KAB1074943.1 CCA tRNA nucleotidyltransferase [Methylobacterium planeticum]
MARLRRRPEVVTILAALDVPGEETRLVGGCVRDVLLGRAVSDIDLATTLPPQATRDRATDAGLRAIPTGIAHGTVTVLVAGETFEVTTLREDIETDGRHAVVRFGRDFARDAERRDFTINALSAGADGRLHDTTGGLADLAARRVRFIGEPATRIREDALRILRFFRFHARYGSGEPDRAGLAACIAARDALDGLSRERVRGEVLKLLMAPGALAAAGILSRTGLLPRLTGGIGDLGRLGRGIAAEATAIERLAALSVASAADADRLRDALRLSNPEHARLLAHARAVAALRDPATIGAQALRGLAAEHGAPILAATIAILAGEPRPHLTPEAGAMLENLLRPDAVAPVFPLAGADLVARGVSPGPRIGRALAAARAGWLALGCPMDADARKTLLALALDAANEEPAGSA